MLPRPDDAVRATKSADERTDSETDATLVPSEADSTKLRAPGDAPGLSIVYHIYHPKESRRHLVITTTVNERLEKIFPPTKKSWAKKMKKKAAAAAAEAEDEELPAEEKGEAGYFVRKPYLSFHDPPSVFMQGVAKDGPPICLIHPSWFWRRIRLQLGERLADDGVIDPRGVVSWCHNVDKKSRGDADLKGYKIRTWRLWLETGKKYHREVNERRKAGLQDEKAWDTADEKPNKPIIDEVVDLVWDTPFSFRETRRYSFRYGGLEFRWKGTGTVKESRCCGFFLRYNHLKLVARVPLGTSADLQLSKTASKRKNQDSEFGEVCLAKYTSQIGVKKAGRLEVFEPAIHRVYQDYITLQAGMIKHVVDDIAGLRQTRLYHVVMATALCMVEQEWQKREAVKKTIEILIAGGEGAS